MRTAMLVALATLSAAAIACWACLGAARPLPPPAAPSTWRWQWSGLRADAAAALRNATLGAPEEFRVLEDALERGVQRQRRRLLAERAGRRRGAWQRLLAVAGGARRGVSRRMRRLQEAGGAPGAAHRHTKFAASAGMPAAGAPPAPDGGDDAGAGDGAHAGKPWLAAAPHLPAPALEEACYNSAYTDGASGNSAGTIILTSGAPRAAAGPALARGLRLQRFPRGSNSAPASPCMHQAPSCFLQAGLLKGSGRVSRRWSHAQPRLRGADPSAARAGNKFMLGRLLPRFLKGAKTTLTGDVSNHVVVVALGPSARNVCSGLTARYSHQCVEDPNWDGPEGQYDVGDEWFMAVSQNKLELVLNVMTLGYSVLWRARPASQAASPDLPTCVLTMLWAAPVCSQVRGCRKAWTGTKFAHLRADGHAHPTFGRFETLCALHELFTQIVVRARRMDLDVVPYRNPLPYLIGLSADVAVPNSACAATNDAEPLRAGQRLEQDTGLLYADANPRALRFVYDWLRVQRHYRCARPPRRSALRMHVAPARRSVPETRVRMCKGWVVPMGH